MLVDPMMAFRARMRQRLGLPSGDQAPSGGPVAGPMGPNGPTGYGGSGIGTDMGGPMVGPNAPTGPFGGPTTNGGVDLSPGMGNGGTVGAPNHLIGMRRSHGQGQQMNESIPGPRGTFTTGGPRPIASPMIPWFLRF